MKIFEHKTQNQNEQEYLVQRIRTQYTERQHTELDALRALDRRVKTPANVLAYLLGSVSALVLGAGMSLIMTDLGASLGLRDPMLPGMILGVAGLLAAILNYPLYRRVLRARRKRCAPQIIALSDRITGA